MRMAGCPSRLSDRMKMFSENSRAWHSEAVRRMVCLAFLFCACSLTAWFCFCYYIDSLSPYANNISYCNFSLSSRMSASTRVNKILSNSRFLTVPYVCQRANCWIRIRSARLYPVLVRSRCWPTANTQQRAHQLSLHRQYRNYTYY